MPAPHHVVIEVYVLLAIVNAFLGIGQGIYQDAFPGESIRSPFDQFPLGDQIDPQVSQLNTTQLQANLTSPTNATSGNPIDWLIGGAANFGATIEVILNFVKFFTAGYIIDLLVSLNFPGGFLYIITVPMGLYTAYMMFVMITNRLGN